MVRPIILDRWNIIEAKACRLKNTDTMGDPPLTIALFNTIDIAPDVGELHRTTTISSPILHLGFRPKRVHGAKVGFHDSNRV